MIDLEKGLYDSFLDMAILDQWAEPYAVTLTLKPFSFFCRVPLNDSCASHNLTEFLGLLHNAFFSSNDMSNGNRIRCIPVLEIGEPTRYQLCLEKPAHIPEDLFMQETFDCWWATDFAHWDMEIKPADADWIRYLAKLQADTSLPDALDWDNYWNPR